ncbi:hypothetical protein [Helicobacter japonicus]|uniref:hypothetical protein n=1 Tax=Helicobacter japonicus TaxID=425400 RepID=UPI0023F01178|nr:hypothetical protein [Helicobacter japonicus]
MRIKFYAMLGWLTLCSIMYGAQKVPVQDFSRDKAPEEVLGNVSITRQELLYDINGIKIKKPKNPREGSYALVSLGAVYTPSLGTSSMLSVEAGYDFIFKNIHSLRVFGFFDRTNYGAFGDLEFDATQPNKMQIYRGGISAEYRIYVSRFIGFRVRLGSIGAYNFSRTDSAAQPLLSTTYKKWFYPTFAFGPIFTYGIHHELFIGYDLLDYETKRGASVNYLKYSYRF